MNVSMPTPKKGTERVRLIIDTTEERRRAVQIRAAVTGGSPSDVLNELIDAALKAELATAKRALKEQGQDGND